MHNSKSVQINVCFAMANFCFSATKCSLHIIRYDNFKWLPLFRGFQIKIWTTIKWSEQSFFSSCITDKAKKMIRLSSLSNLFFLWKSGLLSFFHRSTLGLYQFFLLAHHRRFFLFILIFDGENFWYVVRRRDEVLAPWINFMTFTPGLGEPKDTAHTQSMRHHERHDF